MGMSGGENWGSLLAVNIELLDTEDMPLPTPKAVAKVGREAFPKKKPSLDGKKVI